MDNEKKYVTQLSEAESGSLPGGSGVYRILIDRFTGGAKHFSLVHSISFAGTRGREHSHEVEHGWYILSGSGTIYMEKKAYRVGPGSAVYTPAGVMHRCDVDEGEDLDYIVIYAPPGPEQQLREKGAKAFTTD